MRMWPEPDAFVCISPQTELDSVWKSFISRATLALMAEIFAYNIGTYMAQMSTARVDRPMAL
jgi:hypothetical protein